VDVIANEREAVRPRAHGREAIPGPDPRGLAAVVL